MVPNVNSSNFKPFTCVFKPLLLLQVQCTYKRLIQTNSMQPHGLRVPVPVKEGEILQETLIGGENSFLVCDNSTLPSEWSRVLTFFLHGMCVGVGQGEVSCVLGFTFTLCSTGQDRGSRYVDVRTGGEMSSICFRKVQDRRTINC